MCFSLDVTVPRLLCAMFECCCNVIIIVWLIIWLLKQARCYTNHKRLLCKAMIRENGGNDR